VIDLNLLVWYSRIPSLDENVRTPMNQRTTPKLAPLISKYTFDFGGVWKRHDHSITINVDPGFELPTGPAFHVGKGTTVPFKDTPSKMRVMPTVFDSGFNIDIGPHLDTGNINYDLITEAPVKLALILSPIMTIPLIWVDPMVAWFDSQQMDAV
jgi:hypothetical protein